MKSRKLTHGRIDTAVFKKEVDHENGIIHGTLKIGADESFHCLKLIKNKIDYTLSGLKLNDIVVNLNDDESELISITIPVDREFLLQKLSQDI